MGIRLNSALVYGVKFTNKETAAFEKFMKGKPDKWLLMRFAEQDLAEDEVDRLKKVKFHYYSVYFTKLFLKRSIKGKALYPYRPYWHGMSKKGLKDVEENFFDRTEEYLKTHGCITESSKFSGRDFIWLPTKDSEITPSNMLGFVADHDYAREIDYALADHLGFKEKGAIITIPGQYPWELGTTLLDKKRTWMTMNGENMISRSVLPLNKENEKIYQEILSHEGTRKDFIKKKKALWDKYHGHLKPYRVYYGDGWHGTSFNFYPIDKFFQFISQHVQEIKYDVMRLEKFLCYYWR